MTEDALAHAFDIVRIGRPYAHWPASGVISTPYDNPHDPAARFVDFGLARAVAEILNAVNEGRLVRAPTEVDDEKRCSHWYGQRRCGVCGMDEDKAKPIKLPGGWSCYHAGDVVHLTHPTAGDVFTMHVGRCLPEFQDFVAAINDAANPAPPTTTGAAL